MQINFNNTEINKVVKQIHSLGFILVLRDDVPKLRKIKEVTQVAMEEAKSLCEKYRPGLLALLQGQPVNHFEDSMEKGNNAIHHAFLEEVYRRAFYNFDKLIRTQNGHTVAQKKGCDVLVYTTADKLYRIDEKIRPKRYDYSDIALEYLSTYGKGAPGWMEKDLGIDYLTYAFIPVKRAYIFPWQQLKAVWKKNKAEWMRLAQEKQNGFEIVKSPNPTYYTLSCAVPTDLLMDQIKEALFVQL